MDKQHGEPAYPYELKLQYGNSGSIATGFEAYIADCSAGYLAEVFNTGAYCVSDDYSGISWDNVKKSRFIESLLLGVPVYAMLFMHSKNDGATAIIDGVQRLNAVTEYIHGGLKLSGLNVLASLNGTKYADLYRSRQKRISNRPIQCFYLPEDSGSDVVTDIAGRLNNNE